MDKPEYKLKLSDNDWISINGKVSGDEASEQINYTRTMSLYVRFCIRTDHLTFYCTDERDVNSCHVIFRCLTRVINHVQIQWSFKFNFALVINVSYITQMDHLLTPL